MDDMAAMIESQRLMREASIEHERQAARWRRKVAMMQAGLDIMVGAEIGPLYAMLNPDPRAYQIARAGADRVQAAALQFIAEISGENSHADSQKQAVSVAETGKDFLPPIR